MTMIRDHDHASYRCGRRDHHTSTKQRPYDVGSITVIAHHRPSLGFGVLITGHVIVTQCKWSQPGVASCLIMILCVRVLITGHVITTNANGVGLVGPLI